MPIFAWLYWNPPRELFTIPFIERPVAVYGVLFVAGFIIGYFILASLLKNKMQNSKVISMRDIPSWVKLVSSLTEAIENPNNRMHSFLIANKCPEALAQPASDKQKKTILAILMAYVEKFDKNSLELALPGAITTSKEWGYFLTDQMTWFVVLGTIIGSRLGHVFFYAWPYYQNNLLDIFKIWEGGLASHGGVVGVLIAIFIYDRAILSKFPEITFVGLMDCMVIPSSLVAVFIRIGNFFNQEILGPPSTLPWAIIFGDPFDKEPIEPRHPSQLYEAFAYLIVFFVLLWIWKKWKNIPIGTISGLFFIVAFTFRFFIEFLKLPQSMMIDESLLQMGQYLSIPFILFGVYLLLYGRTLDKKITVRA